MFRRRREMKTDYNQRLALLKSRKPRLVVRMSLNGIRCQVIEYNKNGDKTVVEVTSSALKQFGWLGHRANIPAAYLTGMITGFSAMKKGIKEAIVDAGLQHSTKGNTLYACVTGAADVGLKIPLSKEIVPGRERLTGRHIAQFALLLKKTPDKYKRQFAQYLKSGLEPERLEDHVAATENKIREQFKDVAKLAAFEETAKSFLKSQHSTVFK